MNKFLKSALAAVLIAVLAVSSFAAGSLVTISVDPSIQILVNGNVFQPKDANGNDVMTFTYNGTTYAPLRAMAEAFGLEVGYDADRRMATVNEYTAFTPEEADSYGESGALFMAKAYLRTMAFSREGLIWQLEFSGYSPSEALYAVENCGADWYEQAVKKAKDYIALIDFTYDQLVHQLEYENFTHDQAIYGADNCGKVWSEQNDSGFDFSQDYAFSFSSDPH